MIIKNNRLKLFALNAFLLCGLQIFAQESISIGEKNNTTLIINSWERTNNLVMVGLGSTLVNGDINTPNYENYIQLQYKRFIISNFNINGNLKKFDIKNYDFANNGFVSLDLNFEWYFLPNKRFTPYTYLGAGILTSNDFNDLNYKTQGGIGLEFLITKQIAVLTTAEANYIYKEHNGTQLLQEADKLYYNALLGVHFYFGNTNSPKREAIINKETVINSNPIIH